MPNTTLTPQDLQDLHDEIVAGLAQLIADAAKRQSPAWGAL